MSVLFGVLSALNGACEATCLGMSKLVRHSLLPDKERQQPSPTKSVFDYSPVV